MDDLTITLTKMDEEQTAVFANGVLLCACSKDEAQAVKELIERLYRERLIFKEKAGER